MQIKEYKKGVVSIIVPVYNTESFVDQCIETILYQTHKNIEIILVDDGSTDKSGMICDRYAKLDYRITVVHKQNEGPGIARNTGLTISYGEYVVFVDSDDLIDPDAINYLVEQIITNDCDYVETPISKLENNKKGNENKKILSFNNYGNNLSFFLTNKYSISSCGKIFRHSFLSKNKITFPNTKTLFFEDKIFTFYCIINAQKITIINHRLYYYRDRYGSTSNVTKGLVAFDDINNYSKLIFYDNNTPDYYHKRHYLIHFNLLGDDLYQLGLPNSFKRIIKTISLFKLINDKKFFMRQNKQYHLHKKNEMRKAASSKYTYYLNTALMSYLSNGNIMLFFINTSLLNFMFKITRAFKKRH